MHVISIGAKLKSTSEFEVTGFDFFSPNNILDAELIFWDMESTYSDLVGRPGRINTITHYQLERYQEGFNLRTKEFNEFFSLGRTLVITAPTNEIYSYEADGSGEELTIDLWNSLEINSPNYSINRGKNIGTIDKDFTERFLKKNSKKLSYSRRIEQSDGIPLFFIKGTDYVVGEYYRLDKGLVILLPDFSVSNTEESQQFLNSILLLSEGLHSLTPKIKVKFPTLVDEYLLNEEVSEQKSFKDLVEKKESIELQIKKQREILEDYKSLKLLFAGDGELLEQICKRIFEDFGFDVIKNENSRDDLIIRKGEKVGIVEVKGVTKSSAEKHSAQLQKWVSDYYAENDIDPKGILIVNTFKKLRLEDRNEDDFPDQMMKHVNQMEHCLITGIQLLCLYLDYKRGKITTEKVIDLIFKKTGELKYTEDVEKYILPYKDI